MDGCAVSTIGAGLAFFTLGPGEVDIHVCAAITVLERFDRFDVIEIPLRVRVTLGQIILRLGDYRPGESGVFDFFALAASQDHQTDRHSGDDGDTLEIFAVTHSFLLSINGLID
jgi:hypothetical protein